MREAGFWASVLVALALLCLVWPSEIVLGTFAFLAFLAFVLFEFLNITRWIANLFNRVAGEPSPDSVDRTVGLMYRDRDYANTRNAKQDLGGKHGGA